MFSERTQDMVMVARGPIVLKPTLRSPGGPIAPNSKMLETQRESFISAFVTVKPLVNLHR